MELSIDILLLLLNFMCVFLHICSYIFVPYCIFNSSTNNEEEQEENGKKVSKNIFVLSITQRMFCAYQL